MTITLLNLFCILGFHWIADFIFQTSWMATNKSKNNKALLSHVVVYSWIITIGLYLFTDISLSGAGIFWGITFITHFITDYFTSRLNTYLWNKQDVHNFFVSVGLDQLIHFITLISTFVWILE